MSVNKMKIVRGSGACSVAALGFVVMIGCGKPESTADPEPAAGTTAGPIGSTPAAPMAGDAVTAERDHVGADENGAAFASLTPAQRQAAMEQSVCPVSGQSLGSMGTPIPVDVKGRTVWICCESCQQNLMQEPEKYLAKLDSE